MTSRARVMTAIAGEEPDQVPFLDYFETEVKQKIMGTDEIDEAEFAKKIGMDGIYFTDYVAPTFCKPAEGESFIPLADSGSQQLEFQGEGLIRSENDLDIMQFHDPHDDKYYDAARIFIDRYGGSNLAIYATMRPLGFFGVMFSMPMEDFSVALYENRKLIDTMMDRYVEWNCVVIEKLQTLGIDFILANNDMAFKTGPLISPQIFREVFLPKMKIVADTINVPWAFHSDGDLNMVLDDLLTLGMDAINPIEPPIMDLAQIKKERGSNICLWGNIDLDNLIRGTPEEIDEEVKEKIEIAAPGGGYICGSSNSVTSYCKLENVYAMLDAVKKYGKYPIEESKQ